MTPVDNLVEQLRSDLLGGTGELIGAHFAREGLMAPLHRWSPSRHDLHHPLHRDYASLLSSIMQEDGTVRLFAFEKLDLGGMADWLMVVMPQDTEGDFVYCRYGRKIADIFGRDMTGEPVSGVGTFIGPYFIATYLAVTGRKKWLLTVHEPPRHVFARAWRRLMVPLVDEDDQVAAVATLNIPANDLGEGLEIVPDPVVIANAAGELVYANTPARARFGDPGPGTGATKIDAYLGFPVSLPTPNQPATHLSAADSHMDTVRDGILIRVQVSVRLITYRDQPYFAIYLRQA